MHTYMYMYIHDYTRTYTIIDHTFYLPTIHVYISFSIPITLPSSLTLALHVNVPDLIEDGFHTSI